MGTEKKEKVLKSVSEKPNLNWDESRHNGGGKNKERKACFLSALEIEPGKETVELWITSMRNHSRIMLIILVLTLVYLLFL